MSEGAIVIDAGPLVAYFSEREHHHAWVRETADALPTPFLTSEPALTEAAFLLQRQKLSLAPLFELLENSVILVAVDVQEELGSLGKLIEKYTDLPMSLADATLVRIAELNDHASVFTLDRHFRIYRKHGRRQIPLIIPEGH